MLKQPAVTCFEQDNTVSIYTLRIKLVAHIFVIDIFKSLLSTLLGT